MNDTQTQPTLPKWEARGRQIYEDYRYVASVGIPVSNGWSHEVERAYIDKATAIARACNSHDDLVAALRGLQRALMLETRAEAEGSTINERLLMEAMRAADMALAKAEGKKVDNV